MSDPSVTYRDATYSAETQADLEWLLRDMEAGNWGNARQLTAIQDVVRRWNENDATETVFEDDA